MNKFLSSFLFFACSILCMQISLDASNQNNIQEKQTQRKKVSFKPITEIQRTPNRLELKEACLAQTLWWNLGELHEIKTITGNKLKAIISQPPCDDATLKKYQKLKSGIISEMVLELDPNETADYNQTRINSYQNILTTATSLHLIENFYR